MDNAKVFAETVIRNRKEALNLKRFGVKMGALAAKLESAYRTQNISETISKTVPMLQNCMKKMDTLGVRIVSINLTGYRSVQALESLREYSRILM